MERINKSLQSEAGSLKHREEPEEDVDGAEGLAQAQSPAAFALGPFTLGHCYAMV